MKIRNGFVSNSSSCSFLVCYPKNKEIRLKDIEDYFGGYTDEIPDHVKDIMSFLLWKLQFNDAFNYKIVEENKKWCEQEQKVDYYSKNPIRLWDLCPRHHTKFDEYGEEDYSECEGCEYLKDLTVSDILDMKIKCVKDYCPEEVEILENMKKYAERIETIEIDDNCPYETDRVLTYDDASEIRRNVGNIFKSHEKIIEEEG